MGCPWLHTTHPPFPRNREGGGLGHASWTQPTASRPARPPPRGGWSLSNSMLLSWPPRKLRKKPPCIRPVGFTVHRRLPTGEVGLHSRLAELGAANYSARGVRILILYFYPVPIKLPPLFFGEWRPGRGHCQHNIHCAQVRFRVLLMLLVFYLYLLSFGRLAAARLSPGIRSPRPLQWLPGGRLSSDGWSHLQLPMKPHHRSTKIPFFLPKFFFLEGTAIPPSAAIIFLIPPQLVQGAGGGSSFSKPVTTSSPFNYTVLCWPIHPAQTLLSPSPGLRFVPVLLTFFFIPHALVCFF